MKYIIIFKKIIQIVIFIYSISKIPGIKTILSRLSFLKNLEISLNSTIFTIVSIIVNFYSLTIYLPYIIKFIG